MGASRRKEYKDELSDLSDRSRSSESSNRSVKPYLDVPVEGHKRSDTQYSIESSDDDEHSSDRSTKKVVSKPMGSGHSRKAPVQSSDSESDSEGLSELEKGHSYPQGGNKSRKRKQPFMRLRNVGESAPAQQSGTSPALMIIVVLILLVVLGGAGFGAWYFYTHRDTVSTGGAESSTVASSSATASVGISTSASSNASATTTAASSTSATTGTGTAAAGTPTETGTSTGRQTGTETGDLRANQKDLYYLAQLTERCEDVARTLMGTRWLQRWGQELAKGSKLAYFGLTTLLGSQTLGEEYCDILQYSVKTKRPPTLRERSTLLALHVIAPYVVSRVYGDVRKKLVARHEQRLEQDQGIESLFADSAPLPPPRRSPLTRLVDLCASLAALLPTFETLTEDYLRSVHLAIFYLFGRYYNLSKRLAGIRFISTQARPPPQPGMLAGAQPSSYEVLGVLMGIQIVVRALIALRKRHVESRDAKQTPEQKEAEKQRKRKFLIDGEPLSTVTFDPEDPDQASPYPDDEADVPHDRRCTLCLGARRTPTATECGHVFCWECVVGWAREKSDCPLCRQKISLSRLLPLHNI